MVNIPIFIDRVKKIFVAGPPFGTKVAKLAPMYSGDQLALKVYFVDELPDVAVGDHRYSRSITRYPSATLAARLGYFAQNGTGTSIKDATGWAEIVPNIGAPSVVRNGTGSGSSIEAQYAQFPSRPYGIGYFSSDTTGFYIYWGESASNMTQDANGLINFYWNSQTILQWLWASNGAHALATIGISSSQYLYGWGATLDLTNAAVNNYLGSARTRSVFFEIRFTASAGQAEVVIQVPITLNRSLLV